MKRVLIDKRTEIDEFRSAEVKVREAGKHILKNEWERVKRGEAVYRGVQLIAAFMFGAALFAGTLLYCHLIAFTF